VLNLYFQVIVESMLKERDARRMAAERSELARQVEASTANGLPLQRTHQAKQETHTEEHGTGIENGILLRGAEQRE